MTKLTFLTNCYDLKCQKLLCKVFWKMALRDYLQMHKMKQNFGNNNLFLLMLTANSTESSSKMLLWMELLVMISVLIIIKD